MAHYIPTNLTDPQEFHAEYPNVKVIEPYYWDNVEVGHYVRIRSNNEYFWVQVREVDGDNITGEVYYELGTNPYEIEDTLTFTKCRLFDIYNPIILGLVPGIEE